MLCFTLVVNIFTPIDARKKHSAMVTIDWRGKCPTTAVRGFIWRRGVRSDRIKLVLVGGAEEASRHPSCEAEPQKGGQGPPTREGLGPVTAIGRLEESDHRRCF